MADLLQLALGIAVPLGGAAFAFLAIARLSGRGGTMSKTVRPARPRSVPPEPGWTETVGTEGTLRYGRSGSFNPELAVQEARGRRGELDMRG